MIYICIYIFMWDEHIRGLLGLPKWLVIFDPLLKCKTLFSLCWFEIFFLNSLLYNKNLYNRIFEKQFIPCFLIIYAMSCIMYNLHKWLITTYLKTMEFQAQTKWEKLKGSTKLSYLPITHVNKTIYHGGFPNTF